MEREYPQRLSASDMADEQMDIRQDGKIALVLRNRWTRSLNCDNKFKDELGRQNGCDHGLNGLLLCILESHESVETA